MSYTYAKSTYSTMMQSSDTVTVQDLIDFLLRCDPDAPVLIHAYDPDIHEDNLFPVDIDYDIETHSVSFLNSNYNPTVEGALVIEV